MHAPLTLAQHPDQRRPCDHSAHSDGELQPHPCSHAGAKYARRVVCAASPEGVGHERVHASGQAQRQPAANGHSARDGGRSVPQVEGTHGTRTRAHMCSRACKCVRAKCARRCKQAADDSQGGWWREVKECKRGGGLQGSFTPAPAMVASAIALADTDEEP